MGNRCLNNYNCSCQTRNIVIQRQVPFFTLTKPLKVVYLLVEIDAVGFFFNCIAVPSDLLWTMGDDNHVNLHPQNPCLF